MQSGRLSKKEMSTAVFVGFLIFSVKVTAGTKEAAVFLACRVPNA